MWNGEYEALTMFYMYETITFEMQSSLQRYGSV
jgi:hypothetical protein